MKRIILTACTAAFLFVACNSDKKAEEKTASETSTDSKTDKTDEKKAWIPVDSATEMKAWMEYGSPGEAHKMLAKANGAWKAEVTMWMAKGAPPTTNISSSNNKMVMDGRYQLSEFKGNFMGMPFEGMSITGYDNYKKTYVSTWVDNMGTGIMRMEGPWDDATKSIVMTGKMTNPANGIECNIREIYKIVDDNTQIMEMYGPDSKTGEEYKTMEIKFTRK